MNLIERTRKALSSWARHQLTEADIDGFCRLPALSDYRPASFAYPLLADNVSAGSALQRNAPNGLALLRNQEIGVSRPYAYAPIQSDGKAETCHWSMSATSVDWPIITAVGPDCVVHAPDTRSNYARLLNALAPSWGQRTMSGLYGPYADHAPAGLCLAWYRIESFTCSATVGVRYDDVAKPYVRPALSMPLVGIMRYSTILRNVSGDDWNTVMRASAANTAVSA